MVSSAREDWANQPSFPGHVVVKKKSRAASIPSVPGPQVIFKLQGGRSLIAPGRRSWRLPSDLAVMLTNRASTQDPSVSQAGAARKTGEKDRRLIVGSDKELRLLVLDGMIKTS